MKKPFFVLVNLTLAILATACGSNKDQPVAQVAAAGVTCPAGTVNYNNQCVTTQQGVPPGYNGPGYNSPPPGGYTAPGYCGGYYWQNGYSYTSGCWQSYGYTRWYYYGGVIWYW